MHLLNVKMISTGTKHFMNRTLLFEEPVLESHNRLPRVNSFLHNSSVI